MKTKKTIYTIALLFLAFALVSCSGIFDNTSQNNSKAYISINASNAKTIFPENFELNDPSMSFDLTGMIDGEEKISRHWDSFTDMGNENNIEVEPGLWEFTLTATYSVPKNPSGGSTETITAVYSDTIEILIKVGINPLSFKLKEGENNLEGKGSYDITVNFPKDSGANKVSVSVYDFADYPDGEVLKFPDAPTIPMTWAYATTEVGGGNNGLGTLSASVDDNGNDIYVLGHNGDLAPGKYVLKFSFFKVYPNDGGEYEMKPGYAESLIIKSQQRSSKTINIESLDALHTITYITATLDDGQGNKKSPDGLSFNKTILTFNEHQSVTIPTAFDISSDNKSSNGGENPVIFGGWYTDDSFTTQVTGWDVGEKNEDLTLYAKWNTRIWNIGGEAASSFKYDAIRLAPNTTSTWTLETGYTVLPSSDENVAKFGSNDAVSAGAKEGKVVLSCVDGNNDSHSVIVIVTNKTTLTKELFRELRTDYATCEAYRIPYGFTAIDEDTFEGCEKLKKIVIPAEITSIGENAFSGCTALESVYYNSSLENWCKINFANENASPVYVANTAENPLYVWDFDKYNMYVSVSEKTEVSLPAEITAIPAGTFKSCSALETLTVSATNPPTLGADAFKECSSLKLIDVPAGSVDAYRTSWASYKDKIHAVFTQAKFRAYCEEHRSELTFSSGNQNPDSGSEYTAVVRKAIL